MQHGWCQLVRQEFMENECEALPGVAYPGVRDNRSTVNTKTGYDDNDVETSNFKFRTQIGFGTSLPKKDVYDQNWQVSGLREHPKKCGTPYV